MSVPVVAADMEDIRKRFAQAGLTVDWDGKPWGIDVTKVPGASDEFRNDAIKTLYDKGPTPDERALSAYIMSEYPKSVDSTKDIVMIYSDKLYVPSTGKLMEAGKLMARPKRSSQSRLNYRSWPDSPIRCHRPSVPKKDKAKASEYAATASTEREHLGSDSGLVTRIHSLKDSSGVQPQKNIGSWATCPSTVSSSSTYGLPFSRTQMANTPGPTTVVSSQAELQPSFASSRNRSCATVPPAFASAAASSSQGRSPPVVQDIESSSKAVVSDAPAGSCVTHARKSMAPRRRKGAVMTEQVERLLYRQFSRPLASFFRRLTPA